MDNTTQLQILENNLHHLYDTYLWRANHTLCFNFATAVGCTVANIETTNLIDGRPHLILGRIQLLMDLTWRKPPQSVELVDDSPKVAIVGRPNVGKSALFNPLSGGNRAILVDEPGVPRDRLYDRSIWGHHQLMVVDTGRIIKSGFEADGVIKTTLPHTFTEVRCRDEARWVFDGMSLRGIVS